MKKNDFSIGKQIKTIMRDKNLTTSWLAEQIPCDRSNIYNIFKRDDINTALLQRISVVLNYDFFMYVSANLNIQPDEKNGHLKY